MKTVDYDALAASAPLNRDAALARDGRGEQYQAKLRPGARHWEAPPPTRPIPADVADLTGVKIGRLTVVGYLGRIGGHARWLVRCVCGDYEARRRRAIVDPRPDADNCCEECHIEARLRRADYVRRTGKEKTTKAFL